MRLTIIDPAYDKPYDDGTLREAALGGTEATVIRVASFLSRHMEVTLLQKGRQDWHRSEAITYGPFDFDDISPIEADAVVVVQLHKVLKKIRRRTSARMLLWLHCFLGRHAKSFADDVTAASATVICVSRTHRDRLIEYCHEHCSRVPDIRFIFNPVEVEIPISSDYDRNKLVFLSSPHKGLDEVLEVFGYVRAVQPYMHLYVCNPGYWEMPKIEQPGVTVLGKLPHAAAMEHLGQSLCLFYPQRKFAETFGLVFAESLAMGVPVLTYDVGAAAEVVGDVLDIDDYPHGAVDRVLLWREQRPQVSLPESFSLSSVGQTWRSLLEQDVRTG